MAQSRGSLTLILDGRMTKERDTLTCSHCNGVFIMPPKPAPPTGGFCRLCMKAVCEQCVGNGCVPFERRMEVAEKKGQSRARIEHALRGEV